MGVLLVLMGLGISAVAYSKVRRVAKDLNPTIQTIKDTANTIQPIISTVNDVQNRVNSFGNAHANYVDLIRNMVNTAENVASIVRENHTPAVIRHPVNRQATAGFEIDTIEKKI